MPIATIAIELRGGPADGETVAVTSDEWHLCVPYGRRWYANYHREPMANVFRFAAFTTQPYGRLIY